MIGSGRRLFGSRDGRARPRTSPVAVGTMLGVPVVLLAALLGSLGLASARSAAAIGDDGADGRFEAGSSWDVLSDLDVTDFLAAPTTLRAMRNSPEKRMVRNLERLSKTINALLDFSRMDVGRIALNLQPFALAPLLDQIVTALRSR